MKVNKIFKSLLTLIISLASISSFAQKVELTPFSGYTFKSSIDIRGGKASIEDGMTNGILLGINIAEHADVEMVYSRQETYTSASSYYIDDLAKTKAVSSYLLIGVNRTGEINSDVFKYYVGLKLGAAALTSSENKFDDIVKFGLSFGGGVKYYFSDHIGIRMGANIYAPVTGAGAGLWFSNQGASVSVSTYSPIVQFNLQGGLIIAF